MPSHLALAALRTGVLVDAAGSGSARPCETLDFSMLMSLKTTRHLTPAGTSSLAFGNSSRTPKVPLAASMMRSTTFTLALNLPPTGASGSTGTSNVAIGASTLPALTSGASNTVVGTQAGTALTTGSGNILVGASSGSLLTTGSNNIDLGHTGVAGDAGTIRIGTAGTQTAAFIAGIRNVSSLLSTQTVVIDANGQLGSVTSTSGTVTGVTGTANRITVTGTTTPTVDISSAYVGQSSITTTGTVTSGTWSGAFEIGRAHV